MFYFKPLGIYIIKNIDKSDFLIQTNVLLDNKSNIIGNYIAKQFYLIHFFVVTVMKN